MAVAVVRAGHRPVVDDPVVDDPAVDEQAVVFKTPIAVARENQPVAAAPVGETSTPTLGRNPARRATQRLSLGAAPEAATVRIPKIVGPRNLRRDDAPGDAEPTTERRETTASPAW